MKRIGADRIKHNRQQAKYRNSHKQEIKEREITYRAITRVHRRRKLKEWYGQNTGAQSAHQAVYMAVKTGILERQPCVICGAAVVDAHHHEGYEGKNRLNIIWLCKTHHKQAHQRQIGGDR